MTIDKGITINFNDYDVIKSLVDLYVLLII